MIYSNSWFERRHEILLKYDAKASIASRTLGTLDVTSSCMELKAHDRRGRGKVKSQDGCLWGINSSPASVSV